MWKILLHAVRKESNNEDQLVVICMFLLIQLTVKTVIYVFNREITIV